MFGLVFGVCVVCLSFAACRVLSVVCGLFGVCYCVLCVVCFALLFVCRVFEVWWLMFVVNRLLFVV